MEPGITWYEVLGVLPGADAEKVRRKYEERTGLLRGEMISGAPSDVLVVIRRAQEFLDGAWEILGNPAIRERYDVAAGFRRRGGSLGESRLTPSEIDVGFSDIGGALGGDLLGTLLDLKTWLAPGPGRRSKRVPVPNIRGLFYDVSMEVVGRLGLKIRSVQLTPHPMPVDGLVIDQSPRAPGQLRLDETVTAHVWHPPIRPTPARPAPFRPGR
jgi:hypothetical protein